MELSTSHHVRSPLDRRMKNNPLSLFRRSISLCQGNTDFNKLQSFDENDKAQKPCFNRFVSFQMFESPATRQICGSKMDLSCGWASSDPAPLPYELPDEDDAHAMLLSAVSFSLTTYLRILSLPVFFVVTFAYLFTYLPAPPKAEVYRSLSVIFVLLMGITGQCCFVTAWAARTLGFGDFLMLLRHAISGYL